jgi:hypothetical protein
VLDEASGFMHLTAGVSACLTHLTLRGNVAVPLQTYSAVAADLEALQALTLWLKVRQYDAGRGGEE